MSKYEKVTKLYENSEKFWNLHKNSEGLYEIFWEKFSSGVYYFNTLYCFLMFL